MIEVRITAKDKTEYRTQEAYATYVQGRLIAAGVPLDSGIEFRLLRDGVLQYVGPDYETDTDVWRWYEKGEMQERIADSTTHAERRTVQ